jgi:hypothetical protein
MIDAQFWFDFFVAFLVLAVWLIVGFGFAVFVGPLLGRGHDWRFPRLRHPGHVLGIGVPGGLEPVSPVVLMTAVEGAQLLVSAFIAGLAVAVFFAIVSRT